MPAIPNQEQSSVFTILDDGREIPFPTRDGELRLPSGRIIVVENGVTDFMPRKFSQTVAHYGEQWGRSNKSYQPSCLPSVIFMASGLLRANSG